MATPLEVFRKDANGNKGPATDHYLYHVLHSSPSPLYNSTDWRGTMQTAINYDGNGYSKITRNNKGEVSRLDFIPSKEIQPEVTDEGQLTYKVTNEQLRFFDYEILHIKNISFDGITGINPIRAHRETLGEGLATVAYGSSFFKNGAHVNGALETDKILTPEQRDTIGETVAKKYGGTHNTGKTMVLDAGFKYNAIGLNPQDAMFIETRQNQVKEVARIFGVPLHKLQSLDQSTYRNIEQQALEFITETIYPFIKKWEQELNRKLLTDLERRAGYYVRFNLEGLLRGDTAARATFYKEMYNIHALTSNEIREMENRNPLPENFSNPPLASNAKEQNITSNGNEE